MSYRSFRKTRLVESNPNLIYTTNNQSILRELKYDRSLVNANIQSSILQKVGEMDADEFVDFLRDNCDGEGVLIVNGPEADPIIKGIFNRGFILLSIAENGSGFYGSKNYKKYPTIGGAVYDLYDFLVGE